MNGIAILLIKILIFCVFILIAINSVGITVVKGNEFIILERRFSKQKSNNLISLNGEAGFEADILRAGFYFKSRFLYRVYKFPLIEINPGEVAYVFAKSGEDLYPKQSSSKVIDCDNFQDTRTFLKNGGMKGIQRSILGPGSYAINLAQFTIITARNLIYFNDDTSSSNAQYEDIEAIRNYIDKKNGFKPIRINQNEIGFYYTDEQKIIKTINEGIYYTNIFYEHIIKLPIDGLYIKWDGSKSYEDYQDINLNHIVGITKDGFLIKLSVHLLLNIDNKKIQLILNDFGTIYSLIYKHLDLFIKNYFESSINKNTILDLILYKNQFSENTILEVSKQLSSWNLNLKDLIIGFPVFENEEIKYKLLSNLVERELVLQSLETNRIKMQSQDIENILKNK
ncbi:SPFH domain / Band 7 family protein [Clostridioides difficile CD160]|nr:SPFH domain / Band 7 family protein [Clostridioides difficile CD160]